jgi:hypothetical protein
MSQAEDGQVLVDWVMHNDIEIDAPAEAVWPAIVDTNGWHGTTATSIAGPKGDVGERFDVTYPQAPGGVMLRLQNVELVPQGRRTIRIENPDGRFIGYSSWILEPRGEQTIVTYDVYCLSPFPKESATDDIVQQGSRQSADGLGLLKAFVEKSHQRAEA